MLAAIIAEDLSWDEAFIGYWCRFERNPDVYHAQFWRLLQAPYYQKSLSRAANGVAGDTSVADLLDRYGEDGVRVLARHGLYCAGCYRSTAETLADAAAQHGIIDRIPAIVAELTHSAPQL